MTIDGEGTVNSVTHGGGWATFTVRVEGQDHEITLDDNEYAAGAGRVPEVGHRVHVQAWDELWALVCELRRDNATLHEVVEAQTPGLWRWSSWARILPRRVSHLVWIRRIANQCGTPRDSRRSAGRVSSPGSRRTASAGALRAIAKYIGKMFDERLVYQSMGWDELQQCFENQSDVPTYRINTFSPERVGLLHWRRTTIGDIRLCSTHVSPLL